MKMTPYRKGLFAGREFKAARAAYLAVPFLERRACGMEAPELPPNPYLIPAGRIPKGSGYALWCAGLKDGQR